MYDFPRNDDCARIFCNVEGVHWLTADTLIAVSDEMKSGGRQCVASTTRASIPSWCPPLSQRQRKGAGAGALGRGGVENGVLLAKGPGEGGALWGGAWRRRRL